MLIGMRLLCAWHAPFIFSLKQVRSRVARTIIVCEVYPNRDAAVNGRNGSKNGTEPYKLFTCFCKLFDKRGITYWYAQMKIYTDNRKESDLCLDLIVVLISALALVSWG